jgi:hypothetical protein
MENLRMIKQIVAKKMMIKLTMNKLIRGKNDY